ncbi:MAG: 50S ribosomal protein L22 [Patescibacteria group bacterium]|nr:50S ribosomal protein L22 [Patescibacteria group bacterium]
MITASLNNHRISPRKVRVAANLVRGKSAEQALLILSNLSKKAADPIADLVRSAVANAKNNFQMDTAGLVIKELRVDGGQVLKRSRPRSHGMATRILKRTSHIKVVLAPAPEKKQK